MNPSLGKSISSQEASTLAAKKSAMMILALTVTRQVCMLVTKTQSHQEGRRSQSFISRPPQQLKPSRKKSATIGHIIERRRESGLSGICVPCCLWSSRVVQHGGVLRLGKRHFWMRSVARQCLCACHIWMHVDRHPHGEFVRALSIHFVGVTIASRFADFHSSFTVSDSLRRDWSSIRPLMKRSEPQGIYSRRRRATIKVRPNCIC